MKVIKNKDDTTMLVPEDTLNESIIAIRVNLQNSKLKKSGHNKFSNFDYYELADFLPRLNELMRKEQVNDIFTIEEGYAKLVLLKGEEKQEYKIPFTLYETPTNTKVDRETGEEKQVKSMQDIQYLGALNTYYKRYLYLNAYGITDGEIIDSMDSTNLTTKKKVNTAKETTDDEDLELTQKFQQALVQSGQDLDDLLGHFKVGKISDLSNEQKRLAIQVMNAKIKKAKNILEEASEQLKEEGLE